MSQSLLRGIRKYTVGREIGREMPYCDAMGSRAPGRPPHQDALTPSEWAVVEGVRHGLTDGRSPGGRGVSLDAVKFHVGNALGKLKLDSRRHSSAGPAFAATARFTERTGQ